MEIDYISTIQEQLKAATESARSESESTCVGIFKIKTANQTIEDASNQSQNRYGKVFGMKGKSAVCSQILIWANRSMLSKLQNM